MRRYIEIYSIMLRNSLIRLDKVGSGASRRHPPNDRANLPGLFFRKHRKHPGAGAHRKTRLASRVTRR